MNNHLTNKVDQIAENSFLKLFGRVGMAASLPVLLIGTSWIGNTLWALNTAQAKLDGRVDVLSERVLLQMSGIYRTGDAERDFKVRDQKDVELERRINRVEVELDRILRQPMPVVPVMPNDSRRR